MEERTQEEALRDDHTFYSGGGKRKFAEFRSKQKEEGSERKRGKIQVEDAHDEIVSQKRREGTHPHKTIITYIY